MTTPEDSNEASYFDSLCSMGIEKLTKEKPRLEEAKSSLEANLQVLPVSNYSVFLKSGESVKGVVDEFLSSENLIDNVLETAEVVRKEMNSLQNDAQSILAKQIINGQSVEHHARLLEVLEIPQLMDTYIRNGYYDEALELLNVVTRMERRHSSSLPLVMQIANDVSKLVDSFHTTLLQQLNGSIQLPQCLRIIGCLRRLGRDSELALRVKFLLARDSWLQSQLNSIYSLRDVSKRLSKFTETTRTCLFDIVTQYRAVFSDDEFRQISQNSQTDLASTLVFSKILPGWLLIKVEEYLRTLELQISANEEIIFPSLDSVVNQAMYFGLSFSRIGCDFRPRLVPIFEAVTLRRFSSILDAAVNSFERCSDIPALMTVDETKYETAAVQHGSSDSLSPPADLLAYPILAKFVNGLVSAFSLLLLFCPLSIQSKIYDSMSEALTVCFSVLKQSQNYEQSEQFIEAYIKQVVPFSEQLMNFCFHSEVSFKLDTISADN